MKDKLKNKLNELEKLMGKKPMLFKETYPSQNVTVREEEPEEVQDIKEIMHDFRIDTNVVEIARNGDFLHVDFNIRVPKPNEFPSGDNYPYKYVRATDVVFELKDYLFNELAKKHNVVNITNNSVSYKRDYISSSFLVLLSRDPIRLANKLSRDIESIEQELNSRSY